MTPPKDALEAVRVVASTLEGFDSNEQERIIRWARELIGLSVTAPHTPSLVAQPQVTAASVSPAPQGSGSPNPKAFVGQKNPKNDVQFVATVAYFYRFEAPEGQRKNEINSEDLQEACRLVGRSRFTNPSQTLRNAHTLGLLDKGSGSGFYAINSVGENLVAMTLPSTGINRKPTTKKKTRRKGIRKSTGQSKKK
jgi:hypothetical protein